MPLLPDALAAALPAGAKVTVAAGATIDGSRSDLLPAALAAAAAADVAVVVLGDDLHSCGEWEDRDSLDLPGERRETRRGCSSILAGSLGPLLALLCGPRDESCFVNVPP